MQGGSQHHGTPVSEDALALHIELPRDRYAVCDEIDLAATFRNQTDHDLVIVSYMVGGAEQGTFLTWLTCFLVWGEAGTPLKTTGPIVKSGAEPRPIPIVLPPSQTHRVDGVPLSLLELDLDGRWHSINSIQNRYLVQMVYALDPRAFSGLAEPCWSGEVVSNEVTLALV